MLVCAVSCTKYVDGSDYCFAVIDSCTVIASLYGLKLNMFTTGNLR